MAEPDFTYETLYLDAIICVASVRAFYSFCDTDMKQTWKSGLNKVIHKVSRALCDRVKANGVQNRTGSNAFAST